jgi:Leucine-rich repeat (LRR) protein
LFIEVNPDNIKKNEFIELMLRQNNLDTLEPYIDALVELKKNLIHLSLRDNRFPSFPIELILLTNLTSLSLAENRIGRIADGMMSRLPNLQWLNLSKNRLRDLPADIIKCSQLRGLDATSNKLTRTCVSCYNNCY